MINRLKALLATLGVRLSITTDPLAQLDAARLWDGTAIPRGASAPRARLAPVANEHRGA